MSKHKNQKEMKVVIFLLVLSPLAKCFHSNCLHGHCPALFGKLIIKGHVSSTNNWVRYTVASVPRKCCSLETCAERPTNNCLLALGMCTSHVSATNVPPHNSLHLILVPKWHSQAVRTGLSHSMSVLPRKAWAQSLGIRAWSYRNSAADGQMHQGDGCNVLNAHYVPALVQVAHSTDLAAILQGRHFTSEVGGVLELEQTLCSLYWGSLPPGKTPKGLILNLSSGHHHLWVSCPSLFQYHTPI